jgi:hypothetical protein
VHVLNFSFSKRDGQAHRTTAFASSARPITPSYGPNIGPFEPISVLVSHAHAREYDGTLLVAIRTWMLPGGPRECRSDGRRQKVLNIVQCTHHFPVGWIV